MHDGSADERVEALALVEDMRQIMKIQSFCAAQRLRVSYLKLINSLPSVSLSTVCLLV